MGKTEGNGSTATDVRWADEPARQVQLLTVPEVAARLRVSQAKVWSLTGSGRLRSVKIDSSRRVPEDALEEFVAGLPTDVPGPRAGAA